MNRNDKKENNKTSILEILFRFFVGFLLPFVVINSLILYVAIQVPIIKIFDEDADEYETSKIKFTVDCILPITDVKTLYEDTEIPYTKIDNIYIIDATENGSYHITATAINAAKAQVTATPLEHFDTTPPAIDLEKAIITGNTLIFSIVDDSEINYDNLYATLEDGNRLTPAYIDKSSGTVQFQISPGQKITIHAEDMEGNPLETTFVANE